MAANPAHVPFESSARPRPPNASNSFHGDSHRCHSGHGTGIVAPRTPEIVGLFGQVLARRGSHGAAVDEATAIIGGRCPTGRRCSEDCGVAEHGPSLRSVPPVVDDSLQVRCLILQRLSSLGTLRTTSHQAHAWRPCKANGRLEMRGCWATGCRKAWKSEAECYAVQTGPSSAR